jgi:hypothetical protein
MPNGLGLERSAAPMSVKRVGVVRQCGHGADSSGRVVPSHFGPPADDRPFTPAVLHNAGTDGAYTVTDRVTSNYAPSPVGQAVACSGVGLRS